MHCPDSGGQCDEKWIVLVVATNLIDSCISGQIKEMFVRNLDNVIEMQTNPDQQTRLGLLIPAPGL